jgi:TM2 domain-containing membrane protein YozV
MKQFLSVLALTFFVSSATFASFPVTNSSSTNENSTVAPSKKAPKNSAVDVKVEKKSNKAEVASPKNAEKVQAKLAKKAAKGDNSTVAIILAVVSVLFLPFGLHNWYLGRTKQALWQTLLVFPGFILIIPFFISWIWQIVDLIRLLINGELPS